MCLSKLHTTKPEELPDKITAYSLAMKVMVPNKEPYQPHELEVGMKVCQLKPDKVMATVTNISRTESLNKHDDDKDPPVNTFVELDTEDGIGHAYVQYINGYTLETDEIYPPDTENIHVGWATLFRKFPLEVGVEREVLEVGSISICDDNGNLYDAGFHRFASMQDALQWYMGLDERTNGIFVLDNCGLPPYFGIAEGELSEICATGLQNEIPVYVGRKYRVDKIYDVDEINSFIEIKKIERLKKWIESTKKIDDGGCTICMNPMKKK